MLEEVDRGQTATNPEVPEGFRPWIHIEPATCRSIKTRMLNAITGSRASRVDGHHAGDPGRPARAVRARMLSEASVGTPEGHCVWSTAVSELLAPTTLRLHLGPDVIHEGRVSLWLNRDYIEAAQVRHILPPPDAVEAGADRLTYVLRVSDAGRPTTVTIHLQPDRVGSLSGQIGVAGHKSLRFDQFIYP